MESQSANYLQTVSVSSVVHLLDSLLPSGTQGCVLRNALNFPSKSSLSWYTFALM